MTVLLAVQFLGVRDVWAEESAEEEFFGSRTQTEAALIGIFYDLKQNQQREPKRTDYSKTISNFMNQGWDESILNEFYRVTQPLYATQIFIPYIDAAAAPKAFAVDKTVKPSHWVVHYKGQVSSATGGTFRFIGLADDLLAVAVNSQTVLLAPHPNARYQVDWKETEGPATKGPCGPMKFGTWFTVKKDEVIDLDILVGEVPGGGFGAWLQIEEKGVTYVKEREGHTKFPVFQLVPRTLDPVKYKWGKAPMFTSPGPLWKGLQ
ncbi:MAG: hypothetical protein HC904_09995 [Blastochloris sp.]|nr:hypothetical protein [Blastochloris sp.]